MAMRRVKTRFWSILEGIERQVFDLGLALRALVSKPATGLRSNGDPEETWRFGGASRPRGFVPSFI
jgi:hypothetical protein